MLLVGGAGQLGTELQRQLPEGWTITAPNRAELDVTDATGLADAIVARRPDVVVNASAFHVVDLCESRFAEALAVNAVAVAAMARAAERAGARFVTVSTDYVFDGQSRMPYREEHAPSPVQAYGVSKAAGEMAALAAHPEGTLVVRSCGLYGHAPSRQKGGNFVLNRLSEAESRAEIEVGSDLVCTPTSAADLAAGVIRLVEAEAPPGRYHLTNAGECDWAAFAAEALRLAGSRARIVPVDRGGRYAPARRPPYSVLDCGKAAGLGIRMRPWPEALAEYVRSLER